MRPDFIQYQLSTHFPAIDKVQFAARKTEPETGVFFGRDFDERINAIIRLGSHSASHHIQHRIIRLVLADRKSLSTPSIICPIQKTTSKIC